MKKKFKIIDTSTGQKIKLKEGDMVVMNSQGIFFVVGNIMGYDTYVLKLSDRIPKFDVVWVGEGE